MFAGSTPSLLIPKKDLEEIIRRAKTTDEEIIGIFLGKMGEERRVEVTEFLTNLLQSKSRFRADPEEVYEVVRRSEREDREIIGFFHSHPATPHPSDVDITYMRLWPNSYWLIIDGRTGNYAAWQYGNTY